MRIHLSAVTIALLLVPRGWSDEAELTFERDIRPILKAHCFDCHGANDKSEGELDLRLRRFMVQGGKSGAAIEPGKPAESLLLRRILDGEMPPGDSKVSQDEIAIVRHWIAAKAPTARARCP